MDGLDAILGRPSSFVARARIKSDWLSDGAMISRNTFLSQQGENNVAYRQYQGVDERVGIIRYK